MQLGQRIADRYELVRELGRGACGTVYLARDVKFEADVALKLASFSGVPYQDFRARFVREARIGYLLGRQPGFVRATDWGELPAEKLYLVMDLVKGAVPLELGPSAGTLADRLEAFRSAAVLVDQAHRRGIVHRDVKPGNFLVSSGGGLYLADFGVAKVLGKDVEEQRDYAIRTGGGAFLGTPRFMPPEQFAQPGGVDRRADIYALGVMLFHCLCGRYPYVGVNGIELICEQLEVRDGLEAAPRPRDFDPSIDERLDRVCAAAIALDPAERPGTVPELLRGLPRGRGGGPGRLPPKLVAKIQQAAGERLTTSGRLPPLPQSADRTTPSWSELGLVGADGLTTAEPLRELQRKLGQAGFVALLGEIFALRVQDERPLEGSQRYLGQLAFLRSRHSRGAVDRPIFLGRDLEQSDIVFDLPTISGIQLRFELGERGWSVQEAGSRNGTQLNGDPLAPNEPRQLQDGDVLYLSRHLTLAVHDPASLSRWLFEHVS